MLSVRPLGVALCLAGLVTLSAQNPPAPTRAPAAAARVRAHVEYLASDLLEGREAGTRGYDLAAGYVSTVMRLYGLEPAGGGSFLQPVPLRQSRPTRGTFTFAPRRGARISFRAPDEGVVFADLMRTDTTVTAPLVYAGFGVTAPEQHYDDYATLDVRGKVVLVMSNAPAAFPSELRAHHASLIEKFTNAAERGAVGLVLLNLPSDLKTFAWERRAEAAVAPQVTWLDPRQRAGGFEERLRGRAYLGPAGAKKLFAHSPVPLDQVFAAAEKGQPSGFEFPGTITIDTRTEHTSMSSANVIGLLRGSDPELADTYVTLTAHLDHVGIGRAVNGDRIYNGAFDNALGSAIMLEVARTLAAERPRRSVLFVFVTAEEKGLLGSDYFAHYPPVPANALVANINLDMPVLQWPIANVVAFGAEHSTLEAVAQRSLSQVGLALAPDPLPQENLFVRSDQYSLVKKGVPAIYLFPAFGSRDASKNGEAIFSRFLSTHYHQPGDDLSLPMDLDAVATFTQANYLIALAIANDPVAPSWKPGNFFGDRYGR